MKNLIYSALVVTVLFTACKYEEGPGISLRSKRDRVANEWKVKSYKYTPKGGPETEREGQYNVKGDTFFTYYNTYQPYKSDAALDSASKGNSWGDSISVASNYTLNDYSFVWVFTRTGSYSLEVINSENKAVDPRIMAQFKGEQINTGTLPSDPWQLFNVGYRGDWSFIAKSDKIQLKGDYSGSNYIGSDIDAGRSAPVIFDIVKLANDNMKLYAEDKDGGKHSIDLESFNPDKYLK